MWDTKMNEIVQPAFERRLMLLFLFLRPSSVLHLHVNESASITLGMVSFSFTKSVFRGAVLPNLGKVVEGQGDLDLRIASDSKPNVV
jgi:hypothetical protein